MKLQGIATTAFFPAALAAASISLALLLLPGAGTSAHSSGVAPASRLVAGDVVAAVEAPVHAIRGHPVARQHPLTRTPVATQLSRRKAQASGQLKKLALEATTATPAGAAPQARVDNGHGRAIGRPADVPHGPPAAPPGQAKKAPAADKPAPPGHGGGE